MKYLLTMVFLVGNVTASLCQKSTFKISGNFPNPINGVIYLRSDGIENEYYLDNQTNDSARIVNGRFMILREINDKYTYAFRFFIETDSINDLTGLVFVEPKDQSIFIDSINEYISPRIVSSPVQNEMKNEYEVLFRDLVARVEILDNLSDDLYIKYNKAIPNNEIDAFARMRTEIISLGDSLFLRYAKEHPDSYVTLWKLIERFNNIGYKDEYLKAYDLLSNNLKTTPIAETLFGNLKAASLLALQKPFPAFNLRRIDDKLIVLKTTNAGVKYTLVDFWFSYCKPCLKQFPELKSIYGRFKDSGLEIIGISVDLESDLEAWKHVIEENQLDWIHYLDVNGNESRKMFVNSFPTNYLLDEYGIIIKKNISTSDLNYFLLRKFISEQPIYDKVEEPYL